MTAMVYVAPPLPERGEVPAQIVVTKWEQATPLFAFPSETIELREYAIHGSNVRVIRIERIGSVSDLVAFSQFLYEHPMRYRVALVVIALENLSKEMLNAFIELFQDFPLLLATPVSSELRDYAISRAELKGIMLLFPRQK